MRCALAIALVSACALSGAFAPTAKAEGYSWMSVDEVKEAMEKNHSPGIFFFEGSGDVAANSIAWQFKQSMIVEILKKFKYSCARITASDDGGGRGKKGKGKKKGAADWGSYDGLAHELGVGGATTLVVCAFDKKVLARKCDSVTNEEFPGFLGKMAAENSERWKHTDEASHDLAQVEKWIEQKKYTDAARRLNMVLDKSDLVTKKVREQAKDLEGKLEEIGNDRLEEGKRLVNAGKATDAVPILEETVFVLGKTESAKEAKELLAKAKKLAEKEKEKAAEENGGARRTTRS